MCCVFWLSLLHCSSCNQVDLVTVRDEESPLFGELDVVANRNITVGELGPYAGMLLRDDEVILVIGFMAHGTAKMMGVVVGLLLVHIPLYSRAVTFISFA